MREVSIVLLAVLLLLQAPTATNAQSGFSPDGMELDDVVIYSVSTAIAQSEFGYVGSITGGTLLYIKATSIDPTPSNNIVTVGPYPCTIPDKGVNDVFIVCQTTAAYDTAIWSDLPVVLTVVDKQTSTCAQWVSCTYSYYLGSTPVLQYISPYIYTPGNWTTWNAIYAVSNTLSVTQYLIGNANGARFDLELNEDEVISATSWTQLAVLAPSGQEAGYYNVTLITTIGNQRNQYYFNHWTSGNFTLYNYRVTPEIYSVSSNEASLNGNELTIIGDGFTIYENVVSVTAGGLPCEINYIDGQNIQCSVVAGSAAPGAFNVGAQGVFVTSYYGASIEYIRSSAVKNDDTLASSINSTYLYGTFEIINSTPNYGYRLNGFFRAPYTGIYNFILTADDVASVYLNPTPGDTNLSAQILINYVCSYMNWRDPYYLLSSCSIVRSQDLELTAGSYYYIEAYWYNYDGPGHISLTVETPAPSGNGPYSNSSGVPPPNAKFEIQSYYLYYTPLYETYDILVFNSNTSFAFQFIYYTYDATSYEWTVYYNGVTNAYNWGAWTPAVIASEFNKATGDFNAQAHVYDVDSNGSRIIYCSVANNTAFCGNNCTLCSVDNSQSFQVKTCSYCASGSFLLDNYCVPVIQDSLNGENTCTNYLINCDYCIFIAAGNSYNQCLYCVAGYTFLRVYNVSAGDTVGTIQCVYVSTTCSGVTNCYYCLIDNYNGVHCQTCVAGTIADPAGAANSCVTLLNGTSCASLDSNCTYCVVNSKNITVCLQCTSGFFVSASAQQCIKNSSNPLECGSYNTGCYACLLNFSANAIPLQCLYCAVNFTLSSSTQQCLQILKNYTACATFYAQNCSTCYVLNSNAIAVQCVQCASGYFFSPFLLTESPATSLSSCIPIYSGVCTPEVSNCTSCVVDYSTNGVFCLNCSSGFQASTDGQTCLYVLTGSYAVNCNVLNCATCLVDPNSNAVTCTVCNNGYLLLYASGLCVQPTSACSSISSCTSCYADPTTSNLICTACSGIYTVDTTNNWCEATLSTVSACAAFLPNCYYCYVAGGEAQCLQCANGYTQDPVTYLCDSYTSTGSSSSYSGSSAYCVPLNQSAQHVAGREWVVQFLSYRNQPYYYQYPLIYNNVLPTSSYSITLTYPASPPIGGTYCLYFTNYYGFYEPIQIWNGNAMVYDIPSSTEADVIASAIGGLFGAYDLEGITSGSPYDGYNITIVFVTDQPQLKGNLPQLTFDYSALTGGAPGTSPYITVTTLQNGTNRPFFQPLPDDSVYQLQTTPFTRVTVNGIDAYCSTNCTYITTTAASPIITYFGVVGSLLWFEISGARVNSQATLNVYYAGSACTGVTLTAFPNVTCTIPTADGSIIVEGGLYIPSVLHVGYGYANYSSSLYGINYQITLTALSQTTGGVNGGVQITITGSNFPLSVKSSLQVTFDGLNVSQIISSTSTQIVVVNPAVSQSTTSVNVVVSFNGATSNPLTFVYTTVGVPTVTSVTPNSGNPQLKYYVTIIGTYFGTNISEVAVYLNNAVSGVQTYSLNVYSVNDTTIIAHLAGGYSGNFSLSVWKQVMGSSLNTVPFQYIFTISSISPSQGSALGGTVISITGTNFLPGDSSVDQNTVFATSIASDGELTSTLCTIISQSPTLIQAITPAFAEGVAQIIVQASLMAENICSGNCGFNFSSAITPSLTNIQSYQYVWYSGYSVTLTGTLLSYGSGVYIFFGTDRSVNVSATVTSDSSLQFTVPSSFASTEIVYVFVYVDNIGYAGAFTAQILAKLTTFTPSSGSIYGEILTLTGAGFQSSNVVQLGGNTCLSEWQSSTIIVAHCFTPPNAPLQNGKVYSVVVYADATLNANYSVTVTAQYYYAQSSETIAITGTTPNIASNSFTANTFTIYLTTSTSGINFDYIYLYLSKLYLTYNASSISSQTATFSNVPAGNYTLIAHVHSQGFASFAATPVVAVKTSSVSATQVSSSFAGGYNFTVTGYNFDLANLTLNYITICGFDCPIIAGYSASGTQTLVCTTPEIDTPQLHVAYQKSDMTNLIPSSQYTIFSSNPVTQNNIDDYMYSTVFWSNSSTCFIGYNYGPDIAVGPTQIVFVIALNVTGVTQYMGAQFQGSKDGVNWTPLYTIDQTVAPGQNLARVYDSAYNVPVYYIRLYNSVAGSGTAFCDFSEIYVYGFLYTQNDPNDPTYDINCDANLTVHNAAPVSVGTTVIYKHALTPTVTGVTPFFGWQLGGDYITLYGTNFGSISSQVTVLLDGIPCSIASVTDSQINCTTGNKGADNLSSPKMQVYVNGSLAIVADGVVFYYGLLWSNSLTWGGDSFPVAGDTVYVPYGQTLIVDQSSPAPLYLVTVEGTIIFADNQDLTFDAYYIVVEEGIFIAGREGAPHTHQLTITLWGNFYDSQLPEYGNKVLACHHCTLDLHGTAKTPTWTTLYATAPAGATTLTLYQSVNWLVGDELVIASTDFDHTHSEQVTITSVDSTGTVLTFSPPLVYQHYAADEQYGGVTFPMRAEVGVLSRNIYIRGNPADSPTTNYGGHLMVHGKSGASVSTGSGMGSIARIEYVELYYTGQPKIIGRYAIHFHMNGDCSQSYVIGCAVHDSYARVITLHAVYFLYVSYNVGYKASGHNIFLEDGVEINNIIEYNLIVSSYSATIMLQTDITVASYWITNPLNTVRYNHAAGSDFYGFWYEIKAVPTGPSATQNVCPTGYPLGVFDSNVAHSNTRFGLRFFVLTPRTYPCNPTRDDTQLDPFASNPSIQQNYTNFTTFKNGENGVLAEQLGNALFYNFRVADSYRSAIELYITNFTREQVIIDTWVIVGRSQNNPNEVPILNSYAVIAPRTDGFLARNVAVFNFESTMTVVQALSNNDQEKLWVYGGKYSDYANFSYYNTPQINVVQWLGNPHNVIYDSDGSLTGWGQPIWLSPYKPTLNVNGCTRQTNQAYQDSSLCTIPLRTIIFRNLVPPDQFSGLDIKAINMELLGRVPSYNEQLSTSQYADSISVMIENPAMDASNAFAMVFATGYAYNIHWNIGIDWQHVLLVPTYRWEPSDGAVILRFNNTYVRERIDIYSMITNTLVRKYNSVNLTNLVYASNNYTVASEPIGTAPPCNIGDNFYDSNRSELYLCVSAQNRSNLFETLDLNAIYCDLTCPRPSLSCTRSTTQVRWSDSSIWASTYARKLPSDSVYSSGVPLPGDDVLIPCTWTILIDQNIDVTTLTIDGVVIIDCTQDITITATNIWVRGGEFLVGTEYAPCTTKFTINFVGSPQSEQIVIDNIAPPSSKAFIVTGIAQFYGVVPGTTWTRLAATANVGDNHITVLSSQGWHVGDQLVLAPTESDALEYETVTIRNIVGNSITLTTNIKYFHYGSAQVTASASGLGLNEFSSAVGADLDMRAGVGHITRNLLINSTTNGGWGVHFMVYDWYYIDPSSGNYTAVLGSAVLNGVEIANGGEESSPSAALHLLNTNAWPQPGTIVTGCSIHNSIGIAVNAQNTTNVTFSNNVVYNAERFALQSVIHTHWTVSYNLFIGVRPRTSPITGVTNWDPIALVYMWSSFVPSTDNVNIFGNLAQGADGGLGYAFPAFKCADEPYYNLRNNTAGSTSVGAIFQMGGNECWYAGDVSVYQSYKGIIVNADGTAHGYTLEKLRAVECGTNVVLRLGTMNTPGVQTFFINSYIAAVARQDCASCYSRNPSSCSNNFGLTLYVSNRAGQDLPLSVAPAGFDNICNEISVFQSSFVTNVTFDNYYLNYADAGSNTVAAFSPCANNFAMHNHGSASDATAGHFLNNVTCSKCNYNALVYIMPPLYEWLGWFGGCGVIDCTGLLNVLIIDQDGSLLGYNGATIISNNPRVADKLPYCAFYSTWNAFLCYTKDLAVLEWQALGTDAQLLSNEENTVDNGIFSNLVNYWREWDWLGQEPQNDRFNRFTSLVVLNGTYNITYSGTNPSDLEHRLQHRTPTGELYNYVIVKYIYGVSLAIQVRVNNVIVYAFPVLQQPDLNTQTTICGANNYFYQNRTIHFVVTSDKSCMVEVLLINSVQVNLRLAVTTEYFWDDTVQTTFINRITAFLSITPDRLRIVGISLPSTSRILRQLYSTAGSLDAALTIEVLANTAPSQTNYTTSVAKQTYLQLQAIAQYLQNSISNGNLNFTDVNITVTSIDYLLNVLNYITGNSTYLISYSDFTTPIVQSSTKSSSNNLLGILLGVILGLLAAGLITYFAYRRWHYQKLSALEKADGYEQYNVTDLKPGVVKLPLHTEDSPPKLNVSEYANLQEGDYQPSMHLQASVIGGDDEEFAVDDLRSNVSPQNKSSIFNRSKVDQFEMRRLKIVPVPMDNNNTENMTIGSPTVLNNQSNISQMPFKR